MGSSFFAMQLAELRRQRGEEQRTCPAGDASVTYTSPGEQPIRCVNEAIDEIDHHIYEIIRAVQGPARLAALVRLAATAQRAAEQLDLIGRAN